MEGNLELSITMSAPQPLANLTLTLGVSDDAFKKIGNDETKLVEMMIYHGRHAHFLNIHLCRQFHILSDGTLLRGHKPELPDTGEWVCFVDKLEFTAGVGDMILLADQCGGSEHKFRSILKRPSDAWAGFVHKLHHGNFIHIVRLHGNYVVNDKEMFESIQMLAGRVKTV